MKAEDVFESEFAQMFLEVMKTEADKMHKDIEDAVEAYCLAEYLAFDWESVRR